MGDLTPFTKQLRVQRAELAAALHRGVETSERIAIMRLTSQIMAEMLRSSPVLVEGFKAQATAFLSAELKWQEACTIMAEKRLRPHQRDLKAYKNKLDEYDALVREHQRKVRSVYRTMYGDTKLIIRYNQATIQIVDSINAALLGAATFHASDDDFFTVPARKALRRLLEEERPDLHAAYRAASELPADIIEIRPDPVDRPFFVDAVEFAIGFIPIVGSVVAAYEAYSGRDLFGYALSDAERAVLAASIILPSAGRLARQGHALYTADRMARMYGHDAARWSYAMAMGERVSADAAAIRTIGSADTTVASGKRLGRTGAHDVALAFDRVGVGQAATRAVPQAVDAKLTGALRTLVTRHPALAGLDELALQRALRKGYGKTLDERAEGVKGQLLEELLENRIVGWLREGTGKRALGLEHIDGELRFIPGHLISGFRGSQLTDGVLVRNVGSQLEIVAVFEAKAGSSSAQKLHVGSSRQTKADQRELRRYARDVLEELQERARLDGTKVTETVESIMESVIKTEQGGQIRRSLERLSEQGMWLNSQKVGVTINLARTKWFGVLPRDVSGAATRAALSKQGIKNVDILGIDVLEKDLLDAARTLLTTMGAAP
ncbi:MAG TPA: pre-toxin TG domain-containing protein [Pseudonocardiaceae bacterium]